MSSNPGTGLAVLYPATQWPFSLYKYLLLDLKNFQFTFNAKSTPSVNYCRPRSAHKSVTKPILFFFLMVYGRWQTALWCITATNRFGVWTLRAFVLLLSIYLRYFHFCAPIRLSIIANILSLIIYFENLYCDFFFKFDDYHNTYYVSAKRDDSLHQIHFNANASELHTMYL